MRGRPRVVDVKRLTQLGHCAPLFVAMHPADARQTCLYLARDPWPWGNAADSLCRRLSPWKHHHGLAAVTGKRCPHYALAVRIEFCRGRHRFAAGRTQQPSELVKHGIPSRKIKSPMRRMVPMKLRPNYATPPPARLTETKSALLISANWAAATLHVWHDERADRAVITATPEAYVAIAILTRLHLLALELVSGRDVEPAVTRLHQLIASDREAIHLAAAG